MSNGRLQLCDASLNCGPLRFQRVQADCGYLSLSLCGNHALLLDVQERLGCLLLLGLLPDAQRLPGLRPKVPIGLDAKRLLRREDGRLVHPGEGLIGEGAAGHEPAEGPPVRLGVRPDPFDQLGDSHLIHKRLHALLDDTALAHKPLRVALSQGGCLGAQPGGPGRCQDGVVRAGNGRLALNLLKPTRRLLGFGLFRGDGRLLLVKLRLCLPGLLLRLPKLLLGFLDGVRQVWLLMEKLRQLIGCGRGRERGGQRQRGDHHKRG